MKNLRVAVLMLASSPILFWGCAANVASPVMGFLSTNIEGPIAYIEGNPTTTYEELGYVAGRAEATSILGLVAKGDASIDRALQDARRKIPNTEAIINMTIDYEVTSFLGFFASYTTIVRGTAIRYTSERGKAQNPQLTSKNILPTETAPETTNTYDLEAFKKDVTKILRSAYFTRKFHTWSKKAGVAKTKNEWINSLSDKELSMYEASGKTLKKWLLSDVFVN